MNTPTLSPRVAALLERVRHSRGRIIFALDATASRQPTWDLACQLQSEMFAEVAKVGGLEVQLVWYRGYDECKSSVWMFDADELARVMRRITCEAGHTKIERVLAHVRAEDDREKVAAVIFVGDACEENPDILWDAAKTRQPPWFLFQEGDDAQAGIAFKTLARVTHGAHCRFNASSARELAELLRAVAAFAVGGLTALADLRSEGARKLLAHLKQGGAR
jgi:predicted small metal-binding protein